MSVIRKALAPPHRLSKSEEEHGVPEGEDLQELQNVRSGWLTRKMTLRKKYSWCSLSGRWLSFWDDRAQQESSKIARSSHYIDMASAQQVIRSMSAHTPYGFDIITGKEKTTLIAKNKLDSDQWIECLQMAMQYKRRAQSLRHSSLPVLQPDIQTPTPSEPETNPLYEDPFDPPPTSGNSNDTNTVSDKPASNSLNHNILEDSSSHLYSEVTLSPCATHSPPAAANQVAIYEEVMLPSQTKGKPNLGSDTIISPLCTHASDSSSPSDLPDSIYGEAEDHSHIPSLSQCPPVPAARLSKPQPVRIENSHENGNVTTVTKVRPPPRSVKRATESVMPMPMLKEEEMSHQKLVSRPPTVLIEDEDGTKVVVPLRASRISFTTADDDATLPDTADIYAQVVHRLSQTEPVNDRVSKIMTSLEDDNKKYNLTGVEFEKEAASIKQLRDLLNIPAQPSVTQAAHTLNSDGMFEKMTRGRHMQALHDLIYA